MTPLSKFLFTDTCTLEFAMGSRFFLFGGKNLLIDRVAMFNTERILVPIVLKLL